MVDTTWTNGGGDGKASTAANWSNGIDVGYNVIFDGTSTANCTFDYDGQLGTFTIASGYSGTITQSSDMYISGYSQAGGTFTGKAAKWVYCSGDWIKTGGMITSDVLKIELTGSNKVHSSNDIPSLRECKITGIYTLNGNLQITSIGGKFTLSGTVTISSGKFIYDYSGKSAIITGIINGPGSYAWLRQSGTQSGIINGSINCPFMVYLASTTSNIALNNDLVLNNIISIYSVHASDVCTLDLNGRNLTASSIIVGTRGILQCGEGTITTGSLDSSAGTVTAETSQLILDGAGTLKTNGTDKFYDVVVRDDALVTLASNVTVSNELVTAGEIALAGNTLTHESPSKRYSAPMINPIVRNPKRSPIFRGRFTRNFEKGVV